MHLYYYCLLYIDDKGIVLLGSFDNIVDIIRKRGIVVFFLCVCGFVFFWGGG